MRVLHSADRVGAPDGSRKLTAIVVLVTIALLMLPDILHGAGRGEALPWYGIDSWVGVILIATCLTLMESRRWRIITILFFAFNQLIWLGVYSYFGSMLRPEQIIMFFSEVNDTVESVLGEVHALGGAVLAVVGPAMALLALHAGRFAGTGSRILRVHGAAVALLVLLIGFGMRWAVMDRQLVSFAGVNYSSAIATYRTAVSAARFTFAPPAVAPGHLKPAPQTFTLLAPAAEPVTVVVILGESVNPRRLSLMGGVHETTPNLKSWLDAPPPGYVMSARYGISMGVATVSSLPSFVRTSAVPVDGLHNGVNVFDLARQSGFRSAYFSAQQHHFLNTAGGAPGAAMIETLDENRILYRRKRDEMLVDYAGQFTADIAPRQFIFVHQRVNHSPYTQHCDDAEINIFNDANRPGDDPRSIAYDNGLRCWDRNVARLVDVFTRRPGAVYIFITSDHNEFMGEHGLWGHLHPRLENALVPFIMLTNRPQSRAMQQFETMPVPSFFHLFRAVATAMDVELTVPEFANRRIYVNRTLPFGIAGFMEAERVDTYRYDVRTFKADGTQSDRQTVDLSDLAQTDRRISGGMRSGAVQRRSELAPPAR